MHGHNTRSVHISVNVLHMSRMALGAPGPAEATMILSQNWAKAIIRPAALRQIEYPLEVIDRVLHCRDRAFAG